MGENLKKSLYWNLYTTFFGFLPIFFTMGICLLVNNMTFSWIKHFENLSILYFCIGIVTSVYADTRGKNNLFNDNVLIILFPVCLLLIGVLLISVTSLVNSELPSSNPKPTNAYSINTFYVNILQIIFLFASYSYSIIIKSLLFKGNQ